MITMMNETSIYDPACGSGKALMGKVGSGKTGNLLNALRTWLMQPARQNIFLSLKYSDLTELKSEIRQTIKVFESSNVRINGQHRLFATLWPPLLDYSFESLSLSPYGQSLVVPKLEDIASSISDDQQWTDKLPICSPTLSVGSGCVEYLSRQDSPSSSQTPAICLFLQAYKLTAVLLARLAFFLKTPILAAKKAVAERDYFVVHETHPPAAPVLSGGLLAGAFQTS
jgi:hypothetical protein